MNYTLLKVNDSFYKGLLIATHYEFELLEFFTENPSIEMPLLMDLTLINGLNNNRYVCVCGVEVPLTQQVQIVEKVDVPAGILELSKEFFQQNPSLLSRSVLPDAHQYLLSKGLV